MLIRIVPGRQLAGEVQDWWLEAQRGNPALSSPYFSPEFTAAVSGVRDDIYVAVVEDKGAIVAILPFQRTRWGAGRPVGGPVSDFQGIISHGDVALDPQWLGRGCGVRFWDFPHMLPGQKTFRAFEKLTVDSPYLDLAAGFDAYCGSRRAAGSHQIRETQRKARRLGEEVGPLRFELDVVDKRVLQTLFMWKGQQYSATGKYDGLKQGWIPQLLHRIHDTRKADFAGVLSALYAGEHLVAAHFGMRSERVLHWWYPVYNREFERYSPGLILCLELARAAGLRGIARIDLGYGDERYKLGFMSGAIKVSKVAVDATGFAHALRTGWRVACKLVKATPLAAPARQALGPLRRLLSLG
ncbi:MAG TPA: GNAT family N-acetyltransferase [Verrucomicrobiae bacterium]|nr:GNAT family N-acetyltransferase [Verrucomicrobiae bacterium]